MRHMEEISGTAAASGYKDVATFWGLYLSLVFLTYVCNYWVNCIPFVKERLEYFYCYLCWSPYLPGLRQ
jgi:hypothetical protein